MDPSGNPRREPNEPPPKRPSQILLLLGGVAISGLALWWVLRGIDLDKLLETGKRISLPWTLAAVGVYWGVLVVVRAFLIRRLLSPVGHVPLGKAYRYISVGFLTNTVLPFKMGEIARSAGLARASGIRFFSVVGSLAIERMLDMVMLGLIAVGALQFAHLFVSIPGEVDPEAIRRPALILGGAFLVGFVALIILARTRWSERPLSGKKGLIPFAKDSLLRFLAGLHAFKTTGGVVAAVALSATIWVLVLGALWLRLVAFDLEPSVPVVLLLMTSVGLSITVPSTPGYLGVYHAAVVFALRLLGFDEITAVGFAFFSHLVDVVPSIVIGAVCLSLEGMSWSDLRKTGQHDPREAASA